MSGGNVAVFIPKNNAPSPNRGGPSGRLTGRGGVAKAPLSAFGHSLLAGESFTTMRINKRLLSSSRQLRKLQTPWEDTLWHYLRGKRFNGYRFRRQFVIGPYIVDFCCFEKKLVIELDGGQHNEQINIIKDQIRTNYLTSTGYKVVRFWNSDISDNFDGVMETIDRLLNH